MFKARKKKSGWSYNTSAGFNVSVLFGTAGGGDFVLNGPGGGTARFHYMDLGASASVGAPGGLTRTTEDSYSVGDVLISETFRGGELSVNDFEGISLIQELSVGVALGGAGTILLLGVPPNQLTEEIVKEMGIVGTFSRVAELTPESILGPLGIAAKRALQGDGAFGQLVLSNAKAALLIAGFNSGIQASAGISASVGYVWSGAFEQSELYKLVSPKLEIPKQTLRLTWVGKDEAMVITLPGDVLFDFDKWYLKPEAQVALMQAVPHIRTKSPRRIDIVGHTDSIGEYQYNIRLSIQRASAVKQWLQSRKIVNAASILVEGKGPSRPIAPNKLANGQDNPVGRAKNRRVEIYLIR